jgi:hypothetical protein
MPALEKTLVDVGTKQIFANFENVENILTVLSELK